MAQHPTISERLHESLGVLIESTPHGTRLPSEPTLAKQMGVSRATLREAMRTFETQGMIRRRQGSGTYVIHRSHVIESGLEVLESIETMARRIGLSVDMGELKTRRMFATQEEEAALKLEPNTHILKITRVMHAEGRPVAFLVDVLPEDVLTLEDLEPDFSGSILNMFLERGSPPLLSSRCELNAVTAPHDIARALEIQRGDVLLLFMAYLYSNSDRVVDYSYSYFLPGYFRFHVVRRVGELT